ncbi:hypothetical protein JCM11251_003744 [Rhodosporidiobolus azoricus]
MRPVEVKSRTLASAETRSNGRELVPQVLPYDVLRDIFERAIETFETSKERQSVCLIIATLSSDWTDFGLRHLYSGQLTFHAKRFQPKKKRFSTFYKAIRKDDSLACAVTWLQVDLKLMKDRLTPLLASCPCLRHLGLEKGELELCHLHAAMSISSLSLSLTTIVGNMPFIVKATRPTYPYSLNSLPLFLPNLLSLSLSSVWFNASTISKILDITCLPNLTHLTTQQVFAWSEMPLRDSLFALSAHLTHLTILDPLRWTRHALLRCGSNLQHLRIAELPRNAASLRHVLPFLNASPHPLRTLAIHAHKIPKRATLPDSLSILARGLILGITEKRTSLRGLVRLTLSGPGWASSEMSVTLGLLGSVCALKDVQLVFKLEAEAKEEWVDKAARDGTW